MTATEITYIYIHRQSSIGIIYVRPPARIRQKEAAGKEAEAIFEEI